LFFASLSEDIHASAQLLSELPEQQFIFGKVASMLAANGVFSDEVAAGMAVVWKADEDWTRSLLGGEVKPPEPEEPKEPEPCEEDAQVVAPPAEDVEAADASMEVQAEILQSETKEVEMELAAEPIEETEKVDENHFVQESLIQEPSIFVEEQLIQEPLMPEATDKENALNTIADVGKSPFSKLSGEESAQYTNPIEGLAPKDVNVQPMELA